MNFVLLVGLPGSGKTHFGESLPFPFLDDLAQNGGIELLRKLDGCTVSAVISDYSLIFEEEREKAVAVLEQRFPGCTLQWVVWENNPEQCWKNIQERADGRDISKESVFHDSKRYTYPPNTSPLPVWSL